MGAFPALAISQALPETPMESYQRAAGLKSTLLENQQREQAVQQGAQQQRDQQAATQAMQSWDGKNFMELPSLILKHGGSAQAATAAQQAALAHQEKLSQIAKQDAETGSTNLKNEAAKNDAILGRLQAVTEGPDEGLADRLTAAGQDAVQAGHLDPQHAQQLQQLAALPPDQLRSQLGLFEKGLMGQKQQFDQAQDTAKQKTAQQNADTAQWKEAGQGTLVNLKTGQLIHGVAPVDQQEMQDYLNKHPGKGASDYAVWKAQLAPQAQITIANAAGGGMSDAALDQAAERYHLTGNLPPGGRGVAGIAQGRKIMNRSADLYPGSITADSAEYKANSESLKKLQNTFDSVSAFENTALKNLDQVAEAGKAIPDLGARFANIPVRNITGNMLGTKEMARFRTALLTAQTESARVLNSANASGVLSDSARHEAQEVLNGDLPFPAMMASIDQLKTDFGNRHQSYADQIEDIKKRLPGRRADNTTAPAPTTAPSSGFDWNKFPTHK